MTNYIRNHGGSSSKVAKIFAALWAVVRDAEVSTIAGVLLAGPITVAAVSESAKYFADLSIFAKVVREFLLVDAPVEAALHVGALVLTIYFVFLGLDRIAGEQSDDENRLKDRLQKINSSIERISDQIFSEAVLKIAKIDRLERLINEKQDELNRHISNIIQKISKGAIDSSANNVLTKQCLAAVLHRKSVPSTIIEAHTQCKDRDIRDLKNTLDSGNSRYVIGNSGTIFSINLVLFFILATVASIGWHIPRESTLSVIAIFAISLFYELYKVVDVRVLTKSKLLDEIISSLELMEAVVSNIISEYTVVGVANS